MPSPMMPDAVARFFAAPQARDVDAWSQTFAHAAVARDPVGQPELRGRQQIHARMSAFLPMFRSFALVPVDTHALPDRVAVAWRGVAVTTDGRPLHWSGISFFHLDDAGAIAEMFAYFDPTVFSAQP